MRKIFKMDANYDQLRSLNMVNQAYEKLVLKYIKQYTRFLIADSVNQNQNSNSKIQQNLNILYQQNKCSENSLKTLFFIHFIIREASKFQQFELQPFISKHINLIIEKQNTRLSEIQKQRLNPRKLSLDKALGWFKQKISKSKQKVQLRQQKTFSHNSLNTSINNSLNLSIGLNATTFPNRNTNKFQSTLNTNTNAQKFYIKSQPSPQQMQSKLKFNSKEEMFIYKIIIPYCGYLLKLKCQVCQKQKEKEKEKEKDGQQNELGFQGIWKLVNMLKNLLTIGQVFQIIGRYYMSSYQHLIFCVIKVIDFQLKLTLPILSKQITKRILKLKTQQSQVVQKSPKLNSLKKTELPLLQQLISKHNLTQLNQLLQQLLSLNEPISKIYLCKYFYHQLKKIGICQPSLFGDCGHYQLVFRIISQAEKAKAISRRMSTSKDKRANVLIQSFKQDKQKDQKAYLEDKKQCIDIVMNNDDNPEDSNFEEKPKQKGQNLCLFKQLRMKATKQNVEQRTLNSRRLRL